MRVEILGCDKQETLVIMIIEVRVLQEIQLYVKIIHKQIIENIRYHSKSRARDHRLMGLILTGLRKHGTRCRRHEKRIVSDLRSRRVGRQVQRKPSITGHFVQICTTHAKYRRNRNVRN